MNQYVYAFYESASFQSILITNESVLYTATTPVYLSVYIVIGTRIGIALITWEIVNRIFDLSRHRSANAITIAEQFVKRKEKYGEKYLSCRNTL